ncbi:MAG TPA: hypothetical protein VJG90_00685 [Candidatus Nanoarchaeia archaeon]|nr:hypothetical protein [Candidatus Nanoarchaeia archaeon]
MPSLSSDASIQQIQAFAREVYALPNDRCYELEDLLGNVQRFAMRGLKGIRQGDIEKTKKNLIVSFSWFMSIMNRLHMDVEEAVWQRFPYACSYCANCPCECKAEQPAARETPPVSETRRPHTLAEFQRMFNEVYPSGSRLLAMVAVHLAEEIGEFSEALLAWKGTHTERDFDKVFVEGADYFSCILTLFNTLKISMAQELAKMFHNNCHICHNLPCSCSYDFVREFKF